MRFRNRVRVVRHARGLTVAALVRLSGVSHQTIFALERDDGYAARGQVQLRLCIALNDTGLFWIEREASEAPPDNEV